MPKTRLVFTPAFVCFSFALAVSFLVSACGDSKSTGGEMSPAYFAKVRTFAGTHREFGEPFGIAVKDGSIYVSDGDTGKIVKISAMGEITDFATGLDTPSGIAFDANGDLVVADTGSQTIKKIGPKGEIVTVAGMEGQSGFADGDAQSALFNGPIGVAVSSDGKIFVSDTYNDRIRVIENEKVMTLAGSSRGFADSVGSNAQFDTPLGIAMRNDKVLVADSGNRRIRMIEPDGTTQTLAGSGRGDLHDGSPASASFVEPTAITVDKNGNILIADGNAIRVIGTGAFPFIETLSDDRRGFQDGNAYGARLNRPSGLAVDENGDLFVADSNNQAVRLFTNADRGQEVTQADKDSMRYSAAEFRELQPPRWPFDPPGNRREIAGTLGEIRGEVIENNDQVWFHNGLDIAGSYGETARFIRSEKVLDPRAAENFGTLRELLRMPTVGYIHIRLGRDKDGALFGDKRVQFETDSNGQPIGVRVPRGSRFDAGEAIGTLNQMNHVHLVAGRTGAEMNAIDALVLPGLTDSIVPVIDSVALFDNGWNEIETETSAKRIKLAGKTRIVVRAFDRVDGNAVRRRLGVYRLGYQILNSDKAPIADVNWTIKFDRMPSNKAVRFAYATDSKSGATGETIFNYIVSNNVNGDNFNESFFDATALPAGVYTLRVFAADYFGNTAYKDVIIEVTK
jgi:sugar lactone lactonase YvrE